MKIKLFCFVILLFNLFLFSNLNLRDYIHTQSISDKTLILKTGERYPDQVVAINSKKGIILIDTGISPSLTTEYRKNIEKRFGKKRFFVINTHHHFDHTNGNQVFSDSIIISHDKCPAHMKEFNKNVPGFISFREKRYKSRRGLINFIKNKELKTKLKDLVLTSSLMCEDLKKRYILTVPNLLFNKKLSLNMGDLTVNIIYIGPGLHTDNDIIVYIPDEGFVFTGDLIHKNTSESNITSDNNILIWLNALDEILSQKFTINNIITNHDGILNSEKLILFRNVLKKKFHEKKNKKSATIVLRSFVYKYGVEEGIKKFSDYLKKNEKSIYLWEGDLLKYSISFLKLKKYSKAILLLNYSAKLFPQSVDLDDYLGEAYMEAGNKKMALKTFKKSMVLNPLNSWAREQIFKLSKK